VGKKRKKTVRERSCKELRGQFAYLEKDERTKHLNANQINREEQNRITGIYEEVEKVYE
jgi:hypothetical protein